MSNYNLNSGYGQITGQFPFTGCGKIFCVGDSSTVNRQMIQELFTVDVDGKARFFATIDAAVGECTADAGDIIYVMPGHTETIASATSLVVDVAGVSIIGIGTGNLRPVLDFTATASSVEMDAANCRLSNMILKANVSAVVVAINVDADGIEIDNCEFQYNATGDDFKTMIDVDAFDYAYIHDNRFIAEEGAAGAEDAIRLDDAHFVRIINNHITGDFTNAAIIGEGAAGQGLLIDGNFIYNSDYTAGHVIDLNVDFEGLIVKNLCGTAFPTAPETAFDPGSCRCLENYVCNEINESGALVPTAVST